MKSSFSKMWHAVTVLALCALATGCTNLGPHALTPSTAYVDLNRYAGLWHEVGRTPNPWQRDGEQATAEYLPLQDGTVAVRNTAIDAEGNSRSITGVATPSLGGHGTRLNVQFIPIEPAIADFLTTPNYLILDVDPHYQYALVGSPDRKFLWLLSRGPLMPPDVQSRYLERADNLGYPVDRVIFP